MVAQRFRIAALALLLLLNTAESFTVSFREQIRPKAHANRVTSRKAMTMYTPPHTPTSITAPMSAQKILTSPKSVSREKPIMMQRKKNLSLSPSVMSSSETLPCFSTPNGLLSPDTIAKLDQMTAATGDRSKAIELFLDTYRQKGPMSCLHFLSDPNVLPHLTGAMRDLTV